MLPFRLIEPPRNPQLYPLYPYSVGRHIQFRHIKPDGYPVHQLFLIRGGKGIFRDLADGREWTLEAGHGFLFPPDREHEYYPLSHEPWVIGFVGFYGGLVEKLVEDHPLPCVKMLNQADFEDSWEDIGRIWDTFHPPAPARTSPAGMIDLSALLYRFILRFRLTDSSNGSLPELSLLPARTGTLEQAVSLMNQHYTEPLLVSNLAHTVGYSVQHFQRLFQKEYGVSPHKYLQNLRLRRAVQLLSENSSISVQDLAGQLGMDTNYLIRIFRKEFGCTPGVMRKRLRTGKG